MKLTVRQLKLALETLEWKTGYDNKSRFQDGTIDIKVIEEDIDKGVFCSSIRIEVAYHSAEDGTEGKNIKKTIELYPDDNGRDPVITKTECYTIKHIGD